jgi:hypothetical protein
VRAFRDLIGRRRGAAIVASGLLMVAALPARAADDPGGETLVSPLDVPALDAVVLERDDAADHGSRLLVLRPAIQGSTRAELLVGGTGRPWAVADSLTIGLHPSSVSAYLLRVADDERFVVVGSGSGAGLTGLRVSGDRLVAGRSVRLGERLGGAGIADVDGDGRPELVTAALTGGGGEKCGTLVRVHDPTSLAVRRSHAFPAERIRTATFASLDASPGADLAIVTSTRCSEVAGAPGTLLGLRLADGSEIGRATLRAAADGTKSDKMYDLPYGPLPVRLPGEPTDVLVLADGEIAAVVDPGLSWDPMRLDDSPSRPLGIVPGGSTAVFSTGPARKPWEIVIGRLGREAPGEPVRFAPFADSSATVTTLDRWSPALPRPGYGVRWPSGWVGEVDGDGCPELVVPLVVVRCAASAELVVPTIRNGPAWVATRPIGILPGIEPTLLVGATIEWEWGGAGLADPSPLSSAAATNGWRTGPSVPFALGEVRASELLYFSTFPRPGPTIDPKTGRELEAAVAGRAGDRLLSTVQPIDRLRQDTSEPEATDLTIFLWREPISWRQELQRTPVRSGLLSGVENRAALIPLPAEPLGGEEGGDQAWRIEVVALNDWGEISEPTAGDVTLDLTGPALRIDVPFLSAPWPFAAPIEGTTEARGDVQLVGGETVRANRVGGFEVRTSLAPWPQDLEFRATDGDGNVTIRRVSVMGGIDVRRLPWQGIFVLAVLVATIVAALRDARRAAAPVGSRQAVAAGLMTGSTTWDPWDPTPMPTIEDIETPPRD